MKLDDFGVAILPSGIGLKYIRSQMDLTQEALAKTLGLSLTTVARWERGVFEPTQDHRRALEDYCQKEGIPYQEYQIGILATTLINNHDQYTAGHSHRVCLLASRAGRTLEGIDLPELLVAAILHDLGKLICDRKLLNKRGKYNPAERAKVKQHAITGELLVMLLMTTHRKAAVIVGQHHEKINGGGYRGFRESTILPEAKLLAVCDIFDAITTERPYKPAVTVERAIVELQMDKGLDQAMVAKFVRAIRSKGVLDSIESDDHIYEYENRRALYR